MDSKDLFIEIDQAQPVFCGSYGENDTFPREDSVVEFHNVANNNLALSQV